MRYIHKPHLSLEKLEFDEAAARVVYRGSFHPERRRGYEVYRPEEFIAALLAAMSVRPG